MAEMGCSKKITPVLDVKKVTANTKRSYSLEQL